MNTPLRSHLHALARYQGMGKGHEYAACSLRRLLDVALVVVLTAHRCWRCGGRGGYRHDAAVWATCMNCGGVGFVLSTRAVG